MSNQQNLNTNNSSDEAQSPQQKEVLGLDGKFKWPIRIFTPLLFIATILVNYLMGFDRNGEVSDIYNLWVTPPGWFFIIWAFIYGGLVLGNIYNLITNVWNLKTHIWFGISNILNIVWTVLFNVGTKATVIIASAVLIALTVSIFFTWVYMGQVPEQKRTIFTYIVRNFWAFYLGWCIAASNLNFGIDIVYWWDGTKKAQLIVFWVMAPLMAIGAFTFNWVKYGKYGTLSCFCLWISVAWAFIGAGISSNKCLNQGC